jgi:hypothetical protein
MNQMLAGAVGRVIAWGGLDRPQGGGLATLLICSVTSNV